MKPRKFSVTIYNRDTEQNVNDDNNGKGYMVNKACNIAYGLAEKTLTPDQFEDFDSVYHLMVKGLAFSNIRAYSISTVRGNFTVDIHII